jgi:cytochrome c biogenesis protein CcmG/thiol:disulfide interchange protein DsbE
LHPTVILEFSALIQKKFLIPLVLFLVLVVFLGVGLHRDPKEIPSPLINTAAPDFDLPTLKGEGNFSPKAFLGRVWLFNVWATWCVSCREEHPVLVAFAKREGVPIVGLSYKEIQPSDEDNGPLSLQSKLSLARARSFEWLKKHGDPYQLSVLDLDGRVGINYGVYGVPETYLIDAKGFIRYKHIGPMTPEVLAQEVMPLVHELQKVASDSPSPNALKAYALQ